MKKEVEEKLKTVLSLKYDIQSVKIDNFTLSVEWKIKNDLYAFKVNISLLKHILDCNEVGKSVYILHEIDKAVYILHEISVKEINHYSPATS